MNIETEEKITCDKCKRNIDGFKHSYPVYNLTLCYDCVHDYNIMIDNMTEEFLKTYVKCPECDHKFCIDDDLKFHFGKNSVDI